MLDLQSRLEAQEWPSTGDPQARLRSSTRIVPNAVDSQVAAAPESDLEPASGTP